MADKSILVPPNAARKGGTYKTKDPIKASDFDTLADAIHSLFSVQAHRTSGYIFDPAWKSDQDTSEVQVSDSSSRDLTAKFPVLRPWRLMTSAADDYLVGVKVFCQYVSGSVEWRDMSGSVLNTTTFANTSTSAWAQTEVLIAQGSSTNDQIQADITAQNDGASVGEIWQIHIEEFAVDTSQIPTELFTV